MISLEKSVSTWQFPVNKVIKFGPCWEAPYLWLVTYWQWHYQISWENGGRITKTPAPIAGAPFPFPSFVLFSLPLSLPFLRLPRRLFRAVITGLWHLSIFRRNIRYRNELHFFEFADKLWPRWSFIFHCLPKSLGAVISRIVPMHLLGNCAGQATGPGGGGGGTAIYGLYGYVPLWRVWFSSSLL